MGGPAARIGSVGVRPRRGGARRQRHLPGGRQAQAWGQQHRDRPRRGPAGSWQTCWAGSAPGKAVFSSRSTWPTATRSGPFADDMAVELLVQRGHVWRLATTGKFRHAPALPRPRVLPAEPGATCGRRLSLLRGGGGRRARSGVTDGFVNVDIKVTPDGPRIVEVNGRLGGNVQVMIELAGGPPIMPLVFGLALGHDMSAEPALARILEGRWPRVGYFAWVQAPMSATRRSAVEGLDAVAVLPTSGRSACGTSGRETRSTGPRVDASTCARCSVPSRTSPISPRPRRDRRRHQARVRRSHPGRRNVEGSMSSR